MCIHIPHQPLCYLPQANSTMEVPVTLSPLPQEEEELQTPVYQHNPLHRHPHHKVSSERPTALSEDHEPAARVHHHHEDHIQLHHKESKQKERNEH